MRDKKLMRNYQLIKTNNKVSYQKFFFRWVFFGKVLSSPQIFYIYIYAFVRFALVLLNFSEFSHSHKKGNDSLEARAVYIEISLVSWNLPNGSNNGDQF